MCAGSVWGERQGVCGRVGLRGKAGRRTHAEDKGVLSATVCLVRAGSWVLLRCFCLLRSHPTSCAFLCGREAAACGVSPCAGESPWRYSEKNVLADVVYSLTDMGWVDGGPPWHSTVPAQLVGGARREQQRGVNAVAAVELRPEVDLGARRS